MLVKTIGKDGKKIVALVLGIWSGAFDQFKSLVQRQDTLVGRADIRVGPTIWLMKTRCKVDCRDVFYADEAALSNVAKWN